MSIFAVHYTYAEDTVAGRDQHRPAHRAWLAEQVEAGALLSSGPYPDGSGALLIWRAEDTAAIAALLAADPFARHDLITGTRVVEWRPVLGALSEVEA